MIVPGSLPRDPANHKFTVRRRKKGRMTADEEEAVAKAYKEIKEGRVRTFKNADEYLKYLDTV